MRNRVYLYIVNSNELLVLKHTDFPELGLQIPGGTVEFYECPLQAATREATEETGLIDLGAPKFLGSSVVQSQRADEDLLEAWFYLIDAYGEVQRTWKHVERHASGNMGDVRFELSWLVFSEATQNLSESDCLRLDDAISLVR